MFGLKRKPVDLGGDTSFHDRTAGVMDRGEKSTLRLQSPPANTRTILVHKAGNYNIDLLPEGIIIKRIFSRKGVNQWLVRYHNRITEYYGPTLDSALDDFFRINPEMLSRYDENSKGKYRRSE